MLYAAVNDINCIAEGIVPGENVGLNIKQVGLQMSSLVNACCSICLKAVICHTLTQTCITGHCLHHASQCVVSNRNAVKPWSK